MKKISTILLVMAMLLVTTSCSNANNESSSAQNGTVSNASDVSGSSMESSGQQSTSREESEVPQSSNSSSDTQSSSAGKNDSGSSVQPADDDPGPQNSSSETAGNGGAEQSAGGNSETQNSSTSSTQGTPTNPTETVDNSNTEQPAESGKILIAYFSRVGNTNWESGVDAVASASLNVENGDFVGNAEILAKMAQQATGGDLFLIQTANTYPSDYRQTTDKAKEEQNNNARPALSSHVNNMDAYDTIILIYPNWWGTLPQPLFTFLEEYDFSGKTILPLCTHAGSSMGSSERDISRLCPNATLLDGLAVAGSGVNSAQSSVESWISNSGIL